MPHICMALGDARSAGPESDMTYPKAPSSRLALRSPADPCSETARISRAPDLGECLGIARSQQASTRAIFSLQAEAVGPYQANTATVTIAYELRLTHFSVSMLARKTCQTSFVGDGRPVKTEKRDKALGVHATSFWIPVENPQKLHEFTFGSMLGPTDLSCQMRAKDASGGATRPRCAVNNINATEHVGTAKRIWHFGHQLYCRCIRNCEYVENMDQFCCHFSKHLTAFIKNITTGSKRKGDSQENLRASRLQKATPSTVQNRLGILSTNHEHKKKIKNTHPLSPTTTDFHPTSFVLSLTDIHLSVNSLLHVRVNLDHVLVQLRVLAHHDLRIPCGSHENGLDTTLQRCGEAVGDLKTNEEGIGDDDRSESAVGVVGWVGEDEVEVGKAVEGETVSCVVIFIWSVSTYKAQM